MSFIGKIVTGVAIPTGYLLKSKGIKLSVTVDICESVAALKPGELLQLEQSVIEEKAGKALPKHFRANMRKKLVDKFGKDKVEMVEYTSATGGKSLFVFAKVGTPAPAPAAEDEAAA
jgi:hypothetical protein